jgi:hypothetical protein
LDLLRIRPALTAVVGVLPQSRRAEAAPPRPHARSPLWRAASTPAARSPSRPIHACVPLASAAPPLLTHAHPAPPREVEVRLAQPAPPFSVHHHSTTPVAYSHPKSNHSFRHSVTGRRYSSVITIHLLLPLQVQISAPCFPPFAVL